jgi:two-component system, chemotaxis family, response regulator Rcp1
MMMQETIGRPMEILLVEDNLSDARLAIESLRDGQIKHRLTLICDGEEAYEFLNREGRFARAPRPDLILLDLELPKKGGRELLDEIKHDEPLRSIPVVVLTASRIHEEILRAEHLQVESYITKPLALDKFLEVVRQLRRFWLTDMIVPTA